MEADDNTSLPPKHSKTDSGSASLKFLATTVMPHHAEFDQQLDVLVPSGVDW